jgi:cyclohexa-1,5-dienecarbonyl-CoA hydratase
VSTDTATVSVTDGIGRLVLNNPPLNILTRAVLREVREGLAVLQAIGSLRVVLITAQGKHFSVGADVGEHLPPHYQKLIPEFLDTVKALCAFPLPVVVAVRGRCLGAGFELAVAGDVVIAGEGATFGQPEIRLGVFPPAACAILPEICPWGIAADLVFTGDPIDANEAARVGLVRSVFSDDAVEGAALEFAKRIARHSAVSLRYAKRALHGGRMEPLTRAIEGAGKIYRNELMQTADALEGLQAFTEKRQPDWRHQ